MKKFKSIFAAVVMFSAMGVVFTPSLAGATEVAASASADEGETQTEDYELQERDEEEEEDEVKVIKTLYPYKGKSKNAKITKDRIKLVVGEMTCIVKNNNVKYKYKKMKGIKASIRYTTGNKYSSVKCKGISDKNGRITIKHKLDLSQDFEIRLTKKGYVKNFIWWNAEEKAIYFS